MNSGSPDVHLYFQVLTGELRSNIAHFARDALWLHRVLNDQDGKSFSTTGGMADFSGTARAFWFEEFHPVKALRWRWERTGKSRTFTQPPSFPPFTQETLQVLGFSTRLPRAERVLTKHAATECVENWQCAKTGSHMLSEMEPLDRWGSGRIGTAGLMTGLRVETFLEEVALEGAAEELGTPPLATFSAGDPALDHTICRLEVFHAGRGRTEHVVFAIWCFHTGYELIVQRWRPWSFDASNVRRFRARALRKCQLEDRGLQKKIVLVKRESFTRQWKDGRCDEGKVLEHFETLALAIGADFDLVNLGRLTPCEQADALQDAMLLVAVHGADLTTLHVGGNMIFLPPAAAVVEIGVECELEGASVDSPFWRGPGTWMNSSILSGARQIWKEQQARGWCPAMGATLPPEAWLQGAPTSQFAKLARQANLFYTAVMDCAGAACNRAQEKGQWDRGWCNSDVKKRPFVEVDVAKKLIPVLWVVYDEYLRKLLSASSTVDSDLQGRKVDALVVDTTQKTVAPRKLDSVLRMEYRTKLLNPKWAEAMVAQGSGGAFEVSQRMTALLGWGGTTRFAEDWVWDQSAARYVLDEDMARRLKESNPEAFRNIVGRLLEAQARNLWNAPEDLLERLSQIYEDLDDELEGANSVCSAAEPEPGRTELSPAAAEPGVNHLVVKILRLFLREKCLISSLVDPKMRFVERRLVTPTLPFKGVGHWHVPKRQARPGNEINGRGLANWQRKPTGRSRQIQAQRQWVLPLLVINGTLLIALCGALVLLGIFFSNASEAPPRSSTSVSPLHGGDRAMLEMVLERYKVLARNVTRRVESLERAVLTLRERRRQEGEAERAAERAQVGETATKAPTGTEASTDAAATPVVEGGEGNGEDKDPQAAPPEPVDGGGEAEVPFQFPDIDEDPEETEEERAKRQEAEEKQQREMILFNESKGTYRRWRGDFRCGSRVPPLPDGEERPPVSASLKPPRGFAQRRRVEGQLQLRIKALVFDGVLRTTWTMDEAHLQDGDSVTALVAPTLAQPTRHLRAFAALRRDGQVVAWGDPLSGGLGGLPGGAFAVRAVRSSHAAFAAIGRDGSVVTWGSPHAGGDSHQVQDQLHDVVDVFSTHSAFCALKRDGSVVTWGAWYAGGDS
ncbi:Magnesium-chelatase subunit H (Mg-protoporphyrin IX chelatase subunit H), partial [Durusdinium trenchii]